MGTALPPERYRRRVALGCVLATFAGAAVAQSAADASAGSGSGSGKRAWTIIPRLSLSETLTDNVSLDAAKKSDRVTEISPGVRVEANSARVRAFADYQVRELIYARDSARNQSMNALTSFGSVEAIERFMFVDFNGSISQQAISAFGPATARSATAGSATNTNANSTETTSFQVSPYVRGRLAGSADYELRYTESSTRAKSSASTSAKTSAWTAMLKGGTPLAPVGWSLSASQQDTQNATVANTSSERLQAGLSYTLNQEFRTSINAGSETNDQLTGVKQRSETHGVVFDWTPGPRTKVSIGQERRFFGNSRTIEIGHRTPRTFWQYSESRNFTATQSQSPSSDRGNTFNQFVALLTAQAKAADPGKTPDPALIAAQVEAMLAAAGIPANGVATGGFLSSQTSVQHSRNLALTVLGVRNTLNIIATRSQNDSFGRPAVGVDDFSNSTSIRQRGLTATWSYKLSGFTTLSLTRSSQQTTGTVAGQDTSQNSLNLGLATRIGAHTSGSLGLRRTSFDGATTAAAAAANPSYKENAVTASMSAAF